MNRKIRVGIDVGGTFTKAIAIDIASGTFIGKTTVPTTHNSERGVADGIIIALRDLIKQFSIERSEIELISHSTTQAVNALLEGDTVKVGIIGMGVGLEKSNVVKRTNIKNVELSLHKYLHTCYRFMDTSKYLDINEIIFTIASLKREGADVLVVSEAYGVDDPSNEKYVMNYSDIPITGGHELTGIYGLEIRTLNAAINAGIMPKAISIAKYLEEAVRKENIPSPIMIMKGDGGVTDIDTFKNKPILTILSGPAASVAGALLYSHILHGVFIEIGGTSTNISIIKNGKPEIRYVSIMDHPTCIRSVDVRVAGVAGGSLIRISNHKIIDVGPRSAHIAGLRYSCFVEPHELGNQRSAIKSLSLLGEKIGVDYQTIAGMILDFSIKKILHIMEPMIKEYHLDENKIILVGGGGGASVLVPYMATKCKFTHEIAKNAEVVSSIGVAAAMIYEEIEKTIDKPDPNDVSNVIEEVKKRAIDRGAVPESISIQTEFVKERTLLRAIATGNVELDIGKNNRKEITEKEASAIACSILDSNHVQPILNMKNYFGFSCETIKKQFFVKKRKNPIVILDKFGRIRLMLENAKIISGNKKIKNEIDTMIYQLMNKSNEELAPQIHILDDMKIVDFSSLISPDHLIDALKKEIDKTNTDKITIIIKI